MQKSVFHKIISILIAILLLLPIGLQLFHTLENHKHKTCDVKNVKHFHTQKIDCSFYHMQHNTSAVFHINKTNAYHPILNVLVPTLEASSISERHINHKSSRAPPFFIV